MKKQLAWKFLVLKDGEIVSKRDGSSWPKGKWREVPAPTEECRGLNCSETIEQAHGYIQGDVLAQIEYKGVVIRGGDKLTCQFMRIKKAWHFTAPALKAYEEATATALKAYEEAKAPAWKAYQEATAPARKAYNEATATADKAYNEATATALKAYEEAKATAWKAYEEAKAPAWKAYEEATATAWKAYEEATATAWKAYEEATATAWSNIIRGLKRIR